MEVFLKIQKKSGAENFAVKTQKSRPIYHRQSGLRIMKSSKNKNMKFAYVNQISQQIPTVASIQEFLLNYRMQHNIFHLA